MVGIIAQLAWNSFFAITFFKLMQFVGKLRIGEVLEIFGMDLLENTLIRNQRRGELPLN